MLKIVVESKDGRSPLVRAEGQIIGPWVNEMRRSVEGLIGKGIVPTVDLRAVSYLDRAGIDLLRGLEHRGVTMINCSRFVAEQLRG